MKPRGSLVRHLVLALALTGAMHADANPPFQVSFTKGSGDTWNVDWESTFSKRTFFAQSSVDLVHWEMLPVLEHGTGLKGIGVETGGAPKFFFRLIWDESGHDWITTEQEARDADYDGDGIPNLFEVEVVGSNPLDRNSAGGDLNSNTLPDGWELYHFGALGIADPAAVLQPDGLTNKEKAELGLDPDVDYSDANATQPASFTYDAAGRLTGVTASVATATFAVDAEGNITNAQ